MNLLYQILYPVLVFTASSLLVMTACQKLDFSTITKSNIQNITVLDSSIVKVELQIFDLSEDAHPDYGVCYSETNHLPTVADSKVGKGAPVRIKTDSIILEGLEPGIKIYIRGYVMNDSYPQYSFNVKNVTPPHQSFFIDSRDGRVYQTILIGEQCWMTENLTFLPGVSPSSEGSETLPYYYVYGYDGTNVAEAQATDNYNTYGVLYNWSAALTACPEGWHLPTDAEWTTLATYLGGDSIAGGKMKSTGTIEAGTGLWYDPNTGATNSSGFTALPVGTRSMNTFYNLGYKATYWCSAEYDGSSAWTRLLICSYDDMYHDYYGKSSGFSVRCLKDD